MSRRALFVEVFAGMVDRWRAAVVQHNKPDIRQHVDCILNVSVNLFCKVQSVNKDHVELLVLNFKLARKQLLKECIACQRVCCMVDASFDARVHGYLKIPINPVEVVFRISNADFQISFLSRILQQRVDDVIACVASPVHAVTGSGAIGVLLFQLCVVSLYGVSGERDFHGGFIGTVS
jgi:hypothetical protein